MRNEISGDGIDMTILEIGCCGAYCGRCGEYTGGHCKGCKLGYDTGERDIERAKCGIKLCCFKEKGLQTCADCPDLEDCETIQSWYDKGPKYQRYRKLLYHIRENGYDSYLKKADNWNDSAGKI